MKSTHVQTHARKPVTIVDAIKKHRTAETQKPLNQGLKKSKKNSWRQREHKSQQVRKSDASIFSPTVSMQEKKTRPEEGVKSSKAEQIFFTDRN
jgi:hypothetical protein